MGAVESLISVGLRNVPASSIYFDMGYEEMGEFCSVLTKRLEG